MLAVMVNDGLQAVVLMDGFQLDSRHDLPDLKAFLARHITFDTSNIEPGRMATALAKGIKNYRPELDIYLMSDRTAESIAGSDEVAPIRRMFHHVEELMEIHLAILDGVNQRYDTPYFNNLKNYAQRPDRHLPRAAGGARQVGLQAPTGSATSATSTAPTSSSPNPRATTGGLDSLLEPTGNIKKAQEKAARAFGCQRAVLRHQRHLDLQQDRGAGASCAGRHRARGPQLPQVAPLRPRALRGQPLLRRGLPADRVLDVRRGAAEDDQEGAARPARPRASSTASGACCLTNCTFDGHMYNVRRFMEECLAIKPDIVFLWDEAWFGFARFSPFHRMRSAMGAGRRAERALRERGLPGRIRGAARRSTARSIRRIRSCSTCICCPIRTR